jgi:hypothetical protein
VKAHTQSLGLFIAYRKLAVLFDRSEYPINKRTFLVLVVVIHYRLLLVLPSKDERKGIPPV